MAGSACINIFTVFVLLHNCIWHHRQNKTPIKTSPFAQTVWLLVSTENVCNEKQNTITTYRLLLFTLHDWKYMETGIDAG